VGNWALMLSAIASMISAVGGLAGLVYGIHRTSQMERQRAAEQAADMLLRPEVIDSAALAAVEMLLHHHPEHHLEHGAEEGS
jgi:hypothetical protein